MNFGKQIKSARESNNLTQEDVAQKLHLSRKTISSWETGRSYPDIATLVDLSDIYRISLDKLLREDSTMIKHYEEQSAASRHDMLLGKVSYYLNAFLLLITIINRMSPVNLHLGVLGLVLLVNLIVLMSYFDLKRFFQTKWHIIASLALGIPALLILILVFSFQYPHLTAYSAGEGFGTLLVAIALTVSFLMAVFGKPYMTNDVHNVDEFH